MTVEGGRSGHYTIVVVCANASLYRTPANTTDTPFSPSPTLFLAFGGPNSPKRFVFNFFPHDTRPSNSFNERLNVYRPRTNKDRVPRCDKSLRLVTAITHCVSFGFKRATQIQHCSEFSRSPTYETTCVSFKYLYLLLLTTYLYKMKQIIINNNKIVQLLLEKEQEEN